MNLMFGDALIRLREIPDCSIHSIVTDPPYELGFMNRAWDSTGIAYNVDLWRECLRVLKPGGHLLAFGGSRTYHRMACAVEDAGFVIRDQIMWVYGSGFPKSLDVSKAIDKAAGVEREVIYRNVSKSGGMAHIMKTNVGHEYRPTDYYSESGNVIDVTLPTTDEAKQWSGWGTSLKPAHEPIVVARKPLIGTVVANVLEYGTGAINIGGCRVPGEVTPINKLEKWSGFGEEKQPSYTAAINTEGRWPANLIHDGSDEVLAAFPSAPGQQGPVKYDADSRKTSRVYGSMKRGHEPTADKVYADSGSTNFAMKSGARRADTGSAARFFYCAKASRKDRGATNSHPTVKPTDLMRYLCRLVTPPRGTILDPFTGSGTTGRAALLEGFDFIGIEREEAYFEIAKSRLMETLAEIGISSRTSPTDSTSPNPHAPVP